MIYLVDALKLPYAVSLIILYGIYWYLKGLVDSYMKIFRNLYKTDTSMRRTLWLFPMSVRLKTFRCITRIFLQIVQNFKYFLQY